jgi:hypothetical protein
VRNWTASCEGLSGCAIAVLSGLLLSLGVICIRGASASDAWQYLFWRSVAFGLALSMVTRSGVNGVCRRRTPVSCIMALEIAGATKGVDI